jgi:hypothetical protein
MVNDRHKCEQVIETEIILERLFESVLNNCSATAVTLEAYFYVHLQDRI